MTAAAVDFIEVDSIQKIGANQKAAKAQRRTVTITAVIRLLSFFLFLGTVEVIVSPLRRSYRFGDQN